ncbi:hypothetical protein O6H91_10G012200 [Diphasiastrum complanatum]|uniref:Uncharacterized protein n=2 Tax=Diphasiastrum complanatum TaxID=34168 RepID=A0ACC2CEP4_DIPCM|nr:hypothetical protein O6H91_10G012200 [Diphasiastrum complanatum]KAJ7540386.1 hypothetical protein O6H91_10G012200 [Diphasiastrum complanatum]
MDDFLEHMLSMPSWSDVGGMTKNSLVYNGNGLVPGNGLNVDQLSASKILKASTIASPLQDATVNSHSDLVNQSNDNQDDVEDIEVGGHAQFPLGNLLSAPYSHQREMKVSALPIQGAAVPQPGLLSLHMLTEDVTCGGSTQLQSNASNSQFSNAVVSSLMPVAGGSRVDLAGSHSVGSRDSDGSAGQHATADCQSPPPITATWCQSYTGGVPPLPLSLGQPKSEGFLAREEAALNGANILAKNHRDGDGVFLRDLGLNSSVQDGSQGGLFPRYGTAQGPQRTGQPANQQVNGTSSQGQQPGHGNQGLAVHGYGSQSPTSQPQPTSNLVTGTARPRVRARRGQATDPHSIAERLRRERIAERMKALQELVPNANKTDKASMLDEIIDYVKFLQLQVKVLSMSRLGGAGAIAPLIADSHSEGLKHMSSNSLGPNIALPQDGIALTERQVARLMEEDMGSAMQYLQSKGLCLMPISLATAMSSTSTKTIVGTQATLAGVDSGDKPSVAVMPILNSLTSISTIPASANGGSDGGTISKGVGGTLSDAKESIAEKTNATDATLSLRSPKLT